MALENISTEEQKSSRRPAYERAASRISQFIIEEKLKREDRLPAERELCELLGVSRTVVREAIKVLVATGIVRTQRGSGLYVQAIPQPSFTREAIDLAMSVAPEDMQSLFEFRIHLEQLSARLAAERITPRELRQVQEALGLSKESARTHDTEKFHEADTAFHMGIAQATRNSFLIAAISTVLRLQDWAVEIVTGGAPGSLQVAAEQHEKIFAAIYDGQSEQAAQLMQRHVETVLASYQQVVRQRLMVQSPQPGREMV